ncbi:hypothetical protein F7725_005064 [Dissostichus mawsoni]|uniref:Ig-like domain-containing protein n=1 Tax=Dissostichus mawsoni TaxID=36200 RepID=A0A7J5XKS7_DISMA|nr:hypothetical protein F7725_005064 [Dissostichus mawsoni]
MKGMKNRICFLSSLMSDIIYRSQSVNIIFTHDNEGTLQEKHQLTFRDGQMDGAHKLSHVSLPAVIGESYNPTLVPSRVVGADVLQDNRSISVPHLWIFQLNPTTITWILVCFIQPVISEVEDVMLQPSLMSDIIYRSQSINIIFKHANGGTLQEKHQLTFRDGQMDGVHRLYHIVAGHPTLKRLRSSCLDLSAQHDLDNVDAEVKATPGEDVTLQCHYFRNAAITALSWSRPSMDNYVFYFTDNKSMERYQHPRYRGRVELKDPDMKNGDASVLLKNVKAKPGEDVTLQCNSSRDAAVTDLMWNRPDREDDYVFFFRDNRLYEQYQDPRPEKESSDKHLKNGDANDEQPGGPRGLVGLGLVGLGVGLGFGLGVGLGVGLGLVGLVVVGLVVKSKRAQEKRS